MINATKNYQSSNFLNYGLMVMVMVTFSILLNAFC